jgi:hypothetical protein
MKRRIEEFSYAKSGVSRSLLTAIIAIAAGGKGKGEARRPDTPGCSVDSHPTKSVRDGYSRLKSGQMHMPWKERTGQTSLVPGPEWRLAVPVS